LRHWRTGVTDVGSADQHDAMRILVLGGTRFLSHEVAILAVERGHDVTCAARGQSGAAPDGARLVPLDRADPDGFRPYEGARFDAVLETATRPSWVRRALDALSDGAGHWTYVSSCSVYSDEKTPHQRADAPTLPAAPEGADETDMSIYGELKMASETAVRERRGADAFIVRPGLIVGPGDPSGRYTYWVERLSRGGEVLAPGHPEDSTQVIDVRDLAEWLVDSMEAGRAGTLDALGLPTPLGSLLDRTATDGPLDLRWVDHAELARLEVEPWMGPRSLPLWLPLPEYAGFMTRDVSESVAAGLRFRPIADTARDTLQWLRATPDAARTGLTAEEEAELLRQVSPAG
jgi:nucleoside-diphosphate-sugar epimerase